ncbi:MAG: TetR/AcrR family transcriptional regulator [Polyangiaceae bacterium]
MARPRTIEDEDLLESIRATFLELGPSAPTNELAARASVSEGTLFKRFGNKRAMFVRAMEPPALEGPWYDDMQGLAGEGDLRTNLEIIGLGLACHLRELFPRVFCLFNGIPGPGELESLFGPQGSPASQIRHELTRFFELEAAAGRVRPFPARHLAELFFGPIHFRISMEVVYSEEAAREPVDAETSIRELILTFHSLVTP